MNDKIAVKEIIKLFNRICRFFKNACTVDIQFMKVNTQNNDMDYTKRMASVIITVAQYNLEILNYLVIE